jgi:hypothetical protein
MTLTGDMPGHHKKKDVGAKWAMHYDRSTPLDFTSEERLLIIVESRIDAINQGLERSFAPLKPWACLSVPPTTLHHHSPAATQRRSLRDLLITWSHNPTKVSVAVREKPRAADPEADSWTHSVV